MPFLLILLCINVLSILSLQKASSANTANRAMKKHHHRTGCRPFSYIVEERAAVMNLYVIYMYLISFIDNLNTVFESYVFHIRRVRSFLRSTPLKSLMRGRTSVGLMM